MEILWNAIEVQGVQAIKSFASEEIILNIKVFFENLMKNGYRLEDKCLRNEFLILVNYLSRDAEALEHFHTKKNETTFMELLLFYSTIDEMTFYSEPIKTNKLRAYFGTNSEDLEFKKLIWSGVLMAI
jgi:cilia- and flagella-associated protein 69